MLHDTPTFTRSWYKGEGYFRFILISNLWKQLERELTGIRFVTPAFLIVRYSIVLLELYSLEIITTSLKCS